MLAARFFFNQHTQQFPLYTQAIRFFSHHDNMVCTAVRTLTLRVFSVQDAAMQKFVLRVSRPDWQPLEPPRLAYRSFRLVEQSESLSSSLPSCSWPACLPGLRAPGNTLSGSWATCGCCGRSWTMWRPERWRGRTRSRRTW